MKKRKIGILGIALTTVFSCAAINVNAATTHADVLPEQVTRKDINDEYKFHESGINLDTTTNNVIEFLNEDGTYLLYCTDKNNTNTSKATLTKGSKMDYRIAYILNHGYSNFTLIDGITEEKALPDKTEQPANKGKDMANIWITQVAIWNIQNTISEANLNTTKQLSYTKDSENVFNLSNSESSLTSGTLWNKVITLVNESNTKEDPETATLSITGDTNWTKSDDISKTGLFTVTASSDLVSMSTYTLSLENAPEGAEVHKEDGTVISSTDEIAAGTKIYITVDNTKIDDTKEYSLTLNAKTNGTYDVAYQYVDNNNSCSGKPCQPSVLVGPGTKEFNGSLKLNIIPDTASNISKTIYYVGFIILLIGAGTIYANVRPKKQETE